MRLKALLLGMFLFLTLIPARVSAFDVVCSNFVGPCGTGGALPLGGGTVTGPILFPNGTEALPSVAIGDTDSGFWNAGTDRICGTSTGASRWCFIGNSYVLSSAVSFGWGSSTDPESVGLDTTMVRDAPDIVALRRATNPNGFRVYNTFTDASNYERIANEWNTNTAILGARAAGTGTFRATRLYGSNVAIFTGATDGAAQNNFAVDSAGAVTARAGTSSSTFTVGGVLNVNTTSQATTGTVEEILATYTLPANALSANGKGVRITAWGFGAANANAKVFRLRFGGIAGSIIASGSSTTSSAVFRIQGEVLRTGAATQVASGVWTAGASLSTAVVTHGTAAPTQTLSGTVDIVITGTTAASAGDLTFTALIVEAIN